MDQVVKVEGLIERGKMSRSLSYIERGFVIIKEKEEDMKRWRQVRARY